MQILRQKNEKKRQKNCIFLHFVLFCALFDNTKSASVTLLPATSSPRHPATFTLSHFHTFLYAEQLLKKFYPTFGQKYPVFYPFYPYFRPQKCRFSVGLKCKKWGARGDNNNLYICIIFFLAFSLFKKRESVKVWKWTDFFTFFYFFSRKICKHHNSHRTFAPQFRKAPGATKVSALPTMRRHWGTIEED